MSSSYLFTVRFGKHIETFVIDSFPVKIGKGPLNKIIIDYFGISRDHLEIGENEKKCFYLLDNSSTNGTYLKKKKVAKNKKINFQFGERIYLGSKDAYVTMSEFLHEEIPECSDEMETKLCKGPFEFSKSIDLTSLFIERKNESKMQVKYNLESELETIIEEFDETLESIMSYYRNKIIKTLYKKENYQVKGEMILNKINKKKRNYLNDFKVI